MRVIYGLFILIAIGKCDPIYEKFGLSGNGLSDAGSEVLTKQFVKKLQFVLTNNIVSSGEFDIILNEYVDKIFDNLQTLIRSNNMSIINITDAHLKFEPAGHLDMWSGRLEDIDTISRREDVHLTYDSSSKRICLQIPIKFDDLKFFYDNYHAKVLLINIYGAVHGSVKDIKVNADLCFDFATYTVSLDHYDMKDSGKVSVKFTGNEVVDWLLNAMTAVVDTFLGQVIINVLAKLIRETLRDFCETINEEIAKIINQ